MKEVDFLIVGQGLAGTVLGFLLEQAGHEIALVDNGHQDAASMAAAGMWNPVGFKTRGKTWEADRFLPEAMRIYAEMEEAVGQRFLHPMDIQRIHANEAERLGWEKSLNENHYLKPTEYPASGLSAPHGTGIVSGSGWLDLPMMLGAFAEKWRASGQLAAEEFDETQLHLASDNARYRDIKARCIVYCRGFRQKESKYFGNLPLMATKGDVLIGQMKGLPQDKILHNGKFCIPLGSDLFRMGSTYDWNRTDPTPNEAAKAEIVSFAAKLGPGPVEITGHTAGIRPTVRDRRPLMGIHPEWPSLAIFNGLGTRGVLIAPSLAVELVAHLTQGKDLRPEVRLTRFPNR